MKMKKIIFLFLIVLLPALATAQYERPGSADAQFLKIGVSARGSAMGNAFIAIVDGAEAAYYNPAALAWLNGTGVAFTHTKWFAGINHDFISLAHTFGRKGTFALAATALYTDEMKVRTPLQPDGTGETFYANNYRASLCYSLFFTDRVTFGGTINYIRMSLYSGFAADAISMDIATLYVTHFRDFRFGMKISNFGSEVKFVNESYPLPTNFTFGLAMNAVQSGEQKLLVSFSAIKPNDGRPLGQLGSEWSYRDLVFLRAGTQLNHEVETFAFGGGLKMSMRAYRFNLDYAYNDYSLLGGAHRFALGLSF